MTTRQATSILEGHWSWVTSLSYSADGQILASGSLDDTILLWDMTPYVTHPTAIAGAAPSLAAQTTLLANYPNPFNSGTVISWFHLEPGPARMEVFALTGQRVAVLHQGPEKAGSTAFAGTAAATGAVPWPAESMCTAW